MTNINQLTVVKVARWGRLCSWCSSNWFEHLFWFPKYARESVAQRRMSVAAETRHQNIRSKFWSSVTLGKLSTEIKYRNALLLRNIAREFIYIRTFTGQGYIFILRVLQNSAWKQESDNMMWYHVTIEPRLRDFYQAMSVEAISEGKIPW